MKAAECKTIKDCEQCAVDWWTANMESYKLHAGLASQPIRNLEPMYWPDRMQALADAYGWAMMQEPHVREIEQQAIALLTGDGMSVAKAEAEARRYHKADKMLKQLAETAQTKLMCLQSLNLERVRT